MTSAEPSKCFLLSCFLHPLMPLCLNRRILTAHSFWHSTSADINQTHRKMLFLAKDRGVFLTWVWSRQTSCSTFEFIKLLCHICIVVFVFCFNVSFGENDSPRTCCNCIIIIVSVTAFLNHHAIIWSDPDISVSVAVAVVTVGHAWPFYHLLPCYCTLL